MEEHDSHKVQGLAKQKSKVNAPASYFLCTQSGINCMKNTIKANGE